MPVPQLCLPALVQRKSVYYSGWWFASNRHRTKEKMEQAHPLEELLLLLRLLLLQLLQALLRGKDALFT